VVPGVRRGGGALVVGRDEGAAVVLLRLLEGLGSFLRGHAGLGEAIADHPGSALTDEGHRRVRRIFWRHRRLLPREKQNGRAVLSVLGTQNARPFAKERSPAASSSYTELGSGSRFFGPSEPR